MLLWDAFLEDYGNEIHDWTPRQLLEIFWHYCQDGSKAVHEFLASKSSPQADPADPQKPSGG